MCRVLPKRGVLLMTHIDDTSDENQPAVKVILVVEDDQDVGEFLVEALKSETTCHCLLAGDGFQAIKKPFELEALLQQVKTILRDA